MRGLCVFALCAFSCAADGGPETPAVTYDAAVGSDASASDAGPARSRLVYVSVGGEARLAVVELGSDGSLVARGEFDLDLPGNPGAVSYARSAARLYVGMQSGAIATVALDGDGRPSLLGTTEGTGNPVYVSVAHDESVLVAAFFGEDALKTYDVSGLPPHSQSDAVATANEPHAALIGPTGARVYVPHRTGDTTHYYDVSLGGVLSFEGALAADPGVGPRHIAFAPDGAHAYVVNEFADSISAHTVGADGSLALVQTLPTIPGGFDGDANTCADVHVSPNGGVVYASNRGHDSIAMFAVGDDGTLASLGTVATEATPREFDVSPDGRFVVAAGQGSGFLQSYRVESDGRLTSVARLQVGPDLRWAIID